MSDLDWRRRERELNDAERLLVECERTRVRGWVIAVACIVSGFALGTALRPIMDWIGYP